jgi:AcrR family transcriptional regulator
MRTNILDSARSLISEGGLENISIRKIAKQINYSPAIVYHYFHNKEAILDSLLTDDYKRIIKAVNQPQENKESNIKQKIIHYIELATTMGKIYTNVMLSQSPAVLSHTSILHRGAKQERPALAMLCADLQRYPKFAQRNSLEVELTAQIIWSTLFGLATRIIIENVNQEQRERLTEHAADVIVKLVH